ncbi:MAG TPA: hypothetical protein VFB45_26495 [Pseudolabrys sp.]|nr:hypothetical protein [Pseudolabrys sp.]
MLVAGSRANAVPADRAATLTRSQTTGRYFVNFRSRPGYLFGHTFIVLGRFDPARGPRELQYAGIYPLDGQRGLIIGSVVPVRASIRGVEEDFNKRPNNIYRRALTAREYAFLSTALKQARMRSWKWHLVFANCNDFAISTAKLLGLRTPSSWLLPPSLSPSYAC